MFDPDEDGNFQIKMKYSALDPKNETTSFRWIEGFETKAEAEKKAKQLIKLSAEENS